jgi:hypothetical protein
VIEAVLALVKRFPIWTAVGVFALGGYLFRDVISANVGDLKVGDCFDPPTLTAADSTVKDVQHHPCADLHGGEVFFIGEVPGDANAAYPSDDEFLSLVGDECMPAYLSYTGRDFEHRKRQSGQVAAPRLRRTTRSPLDRIDSRCVTQCVVSADRDA